MKKFQPKSNRMQALEDRIKAINEELAEMGGDPVLETDHPSVQFLPKGFLDKNSYRRRMESFQNTMDTVKWDKSKLEARLTPLLQKRDQLIDEEITEHELERIQEQILDVKREISKCEDLSSMWENTYVKFMEENAPLQNEKAFRKKKNQLLREKREKLEELRAIQVRMVQHLEECEMDGSDQEDPKN